MLYPFSGRVLCALILPFSFLLSANLFAQGNIPQGDDLSLDSLLNITISSVAKYEQTTREAPASVTIITKEDIQKYGFNDISELMNSVRDVYVSDDRSYGYIGIRGFSRPTDFNNRVGFMLNGVVLNENIWGGGPFGLEFLGLNIDDIERVEFIRGPNSALYGNFPMLGVINIITQTGKTWVGTKASVETGSFGRLQGSAAYSKIFKNGLDFNIGARVGKTKGQSLYYEEYDDSTTNNGIADFRDASHYYGFNTSLAYRDFSFRGMLIGRDNYIPTGAYETVFNSPNTHVMDRYGFLELQYSHDINSKLAFLGRTWLNNYSYAGAYQYDSLDGGLESEIANGIWGGAEARLRWDLSSRNRLMVGAEFQHHFQASYLLEYPSIDEVAFDENYPFSTFGIYVQDEYQPTKHMSFTLGGRFDRLYLGNLALTPKVAANFFLTDKTTLKALYGQAYRAANIYEVNVGSYGFFLPNPDLVPERIRSLEFVLEQQIQKNYTSVVSVFSNRLSNLIEQENINDSLSQFQNLQSAGGYGASAELNGRFASGMSFFSNYSFSYMRNLEGNEWLTNSPQHVFKAGISLPFLKHFQFAPVVIAQSSRLTVYDTETKPFLLANANLIFSPHFEDKASAFNRFSLAFKVRNIFDIDYRYPGGYEHLQPSIQQNGRNFNLKLQFRFN